MGEEAQKAQEAEGVEEAAGHSGPKYSYFLREQRITNGGRD